MQLEDLDFDLPKELIALYPKKPRDQSSLLVNGKKHKIIKFFEILNILSLKMH